MSAAEVLAVEKEVRHKYDAIKFNPRPCRLNDTDQQPLVQFDMPLQGISGRSIRHSAQWSSGYTKSCSEHVPSAVTSFAFTIHHLGLFSLYACPPGTGGPVKWVVLQYCNHRFPILSQALHRARRGST